MEPELLIDGLNDKQRAAVAAPQSSKLILAGAGSGKTRVLVHRIAWLMQVEHCSAHSIMAVTFTNKAAKEMRGRVEELLGGRAGSMWIGTFHGLAHRLLRTHYQDAKLPEDFQVLDSDDQFRLLKRIIKALNLDEKAFPPKQAQWFINGKKDEGLRPQHIDSFGDPIEATFLNIYQAYQDACDRAGLVDFAEILLRAHELFLNNPYILEHYQKRFRNVLVDEFQDTNNIQYAWLRLLTSGDNFMMIVGDDDQSIYGWRGAKIENIQRFLNDNPGAETIRLEQNYRSTANILSASNQLIANNSERMGKELWTEGDKGDLISLYAGFNEVDEARFVVGRIKEWRDEHGDLSDCAILYRNNAQSRVIEEALMQAPLPYRIYGGLRFFERQEIKDALAYMRIVNSRLDDAAFERIINTPTRGIGDKTLGVVRSAARSRGQTLWQTTLQLLEEKVFAGRASGALSNFIALVTELEQNVIDLPLHEKIDWVILHSGLQSMYLAEKGEKSKARIENLEELVTAAKQFEKPEEAEEMSDLTAFLTHAALEAGEQQADEFDDAVQMMTMHSAKGLEFPLVFLVGVEEGMFPSQQSAEEPGRLEEERRLCYVGMTRAMKKLYMCYAESRRLYGQEKFHRPSRFIKELPADCLEEVRLKTQVSRPTMHGRFSNAAVSESFESTGFSLGQRVMHTKFGEGTVLNYEGSGDHSRIQVHFDDAGTKWLITAYARLQQI
ncbi:DNA helicase II [Motilimonas pumila]|uniref:DNA 3'-5' helicase n=1 Tax=Motilimonas pumila TaxID=2303987 RepID=A0A418YBR8_9GAMM|nr:DNA helicase II [Motilimonas pumila]RJG41958.1 DNA helicase II [Motilimonas pumila]